jgi:hypothetical protein
MLSDVCCVVLCVCYWLVLLLNCMVHLLLLVLFIQLCSTILESVLMLFIALCSIFEPVSCFLLCCIIVTARCSFTSRLTTTATTRIPLPLHAVLEPTLFICSWGCRAVMGRGGGGGHVSETASYWLAVMMDRQGSRGVWMGWKKMKGKLETARAHFV